VSGEPEAVAAGRIAPEFQVHDVAWVPDAAAPTLSFALGVNETSGREVFTIALTAQINIDPARRSYDAETRAALVELFGAPERWAATTRSFLWAQVGTVVPSFRAAAEFSLDVACTYDLEVAAAKYVYSLRDGDVPLTFHFSGTILHSERQIAMVPWSCSASFRLPVETWRALMGAYYPGGGWVRLETETLDRLAARKAAGGLPSYDATIAGLLG
jgi:hypothetical protein